MRDELLHLYNPEEENRKLVLARQRQYLDSLFARYPQLKENYRQAEEAQRGVIGATLAKLRGEPLGQEVNRLEERLGELLMARRNLLSQLGIDPASLEPQWNCPRCQDSGMILEGEGYIPCSCSQARRTRLFQRQANLPQRIAGATFKNTSFEAYGPRDRAQAQKIYAYVENFCQELKKSTYSGKGLFIHGPTGSGKSHLLGCIANELVSTMSVRYMVYADFLDSLRATFNRDSAESEQQLLEEVKSAGLLLIDDLGIEKPSEFSLKYLAQIIDYRYRNLMPIVVSSNFTLSELVERAKTDLYGERIVWRLGEICPAILALKGNLRSIL
jgi:DNA replication protein DnaC